MSNTIEKKRARRAPWIVGLVGLCALGAVTLYGFSGRPFISDTQECRASEAVLQRLRPLAKGDLAALVVPLTSKTLPVLAFKDEAGQAKTLEGFKGKAVLVNLWATWCVPCREEMPALDKLQADLGSPDFEVVAINVDTRNAEKPKAWLKDNGIANLAYYADPSGKVLQTLQKSGHVVGLPTTLLIDGSGCEIALLKGPAEWHSPDALAFVRAMLGRS
ncbi:TlpA disulfide reductase family protein [Microvirga sp. 2MCAF38]|uniref:thiol:disulfide interchange protein TlpA n=1 Tax=Microvirga sp. 2MCAF38 TaxID=3232989 RepID=UPI003F9D4E8E